VNAIEGAAKVGFGCPLHVVGNHQIEFSIPVIVNPRCTGREFVDSCETSAGSHVSEGAISIIVKETALAQRSYENIVKAVVIVVADGYSQSIHADVEARCRSHITKGSVAVVVV